MKRTRNCSGQMDGSMEGQLDGRTDGQTKGLPKTLSASWQGINNYVIMKDEVYVCKRACMCVCHKVLESKKHFL